MMNQFIGRKNELQKLEKMYQNPNQEVTLIYGRRRVDKSELIKQFLQQHEQEALYYECKQTTEPNNVNSLAALLSEKFHLPPLAFANMETLLDFLFQQAMTKK